MLTGSTGVATYINNIIITMSTEIDLLCLYCVLHHFFWASIKYLEFIFDKSGCRPDRENIYEIQFNKFTLFLWSSKPLQCIFARHFVRDLFNHILKKLYYGAGHSNPTLLLTELSLYFVWNNCSCTTIHPWIFQLSQMLPTRQKGKSNSSCIQVPNTCSV